MFGLPAVLQWRQFLPTPSARRATILRLPPCIIRGEFLPTPSARRATRVLLGEKKQRLISTHALREEGDRPAGRPPASSAGRFLPTPSARRATGQGAE